MILSNMVQNLTACIWPLSPHRLSCKDEWQPSDAQHCKWLGPNLVLHGTKYYKVNLNIASGLRLSVCVDMCGLSLASGANIKCNPFRRRVWLSRVDRLRGMSNRQEVDKGEMKR